MHRSGVHLVMYRPHYNLATTQPGRMMTGFMTPYRHWMWKQNELWRNVHEAQFEHLRRVYRRQWLESFRLNADEYIYKYNITKSAQLAQWEHEMHAQEKKRRETLETAQGRQQLKSKHMDLLREYHERQFFYWYERASERLQYMTHIKYVKQDDVDAHIDKELDKYVAGKSQGYALNFVGQLPMLEDADGNVVEVPAELMVNHTSERPGTPATEYHPREADTDEALRNMVTGLDETVLDVDAGALASAIEDISKEEDTLSDEAKVAFSMEQTEDDRQVARRKYISRGQTGGKSVYRKAKSDQGTAPPPPPSASSGVRRKKKLDDLHRKAYEQDAQIAKMMKDRMKDDVGASDVRIGEIRSHGTGRVRDHAKAPTVDEILAVPELRAGSTRRDPKTSDLTDAMFNRGKESRKAIVKEKLDQFIQAGKKGGPDVGGNGKKPTSPQGRRGGDQSL